MKRSISLSAARHLAVLAIAFMLSQTARALSINSLKFEQLDWHSNVSNSLSAPDSSWGRVTIDFDGAPTTEYFNLNVNGNWVIENMSVDSLYGSGVPQTLTTTFEITSSPGVPVPVIDFGFSSDVFPSFSAPPMSIFGEEVFDLDFQIGGEDNVELGNPPNLPLPPAPPTAGGPTVTMSAKLPNINQVVNQVQGRNECAPGAVSNSLKYLQATGNLSNTIDTSLNKIKQILGTTASGTGANWPTVKKNHFNQVLMTTFLGPNDIMGLINAINAGKDVELDLKGHVAMVAGVRKFSDGRIELDIFDDNQTDNQSDPMRTVRIVNGKVDGMLVERFVVEMAIPEPTTLALVTFGLLAIACQRRRLA
ncbi:MAG: PEP-CTERM sorting domain-containing protein [Planctomycetales bacterium]|nr:PEP-CTERM sorting domain-containing protein [Planctomycetales bacterium]